MLYEVYFHKFHKEYNVSRETFRKFIFYYETFLKWNKSFNLVQSKTLENFFVRHIEDSLQLKPFLEPYTDSSKLDMGTGAGFPGLVLTLSGIQNITLCESNIKKCLFLEIVSRETFILNKRLEYIDKKFDIVVARALAPLEKLLFYMDKVSYPSGLGFFIKGKKTQQEIKEAQKKYSFNYQIFSSKISKEGAIIKIENLRK